MKTHGTAATVLAILAAIASDVLAADFAIVPQDDHRTLFEASIPMLEGRWKHVQTGLAKNGFELTIEKNADGQYEMHSEAGWARTLVFASRSENDPFFVAWLVENGTAYSKGKTWHAGELRHGMAVGIIATKHRLSIEPLGNNMDDTVLAFKHVGVDMSWELLEGAYVVNGTLNAAASAFQYEYRRELDLRRKSKRTVHAAVYNKSE